MSELEEVKAELNQLLEWYAKASGVPKKDVMESVRRAVEEKKARNALEAV